MKKIFFVFSLITVLSINAQVPQDNLQRFAPLNFNANDASGNSADGQVNGATLTQDRFFQPLSAYSFDGINDYIAYDTNNFNMKSKLSLSIWIKTDKGDSEILWIAGKYSSDEDAGYHLMLENGAPLFAGRDHNAEYVNCSSANKINDNNWHHLVGVLNDNIWELWVDGIRKNRIVTTHTNVDVSNTMPFELGRYFLGGYHIDHYYFNGTLDNSRLYTKALDSVDVRYLYYGDGVEKPTQCDSIVFVYDSVKVTDTLEIAQDIKSEKIVKTGKVFTNHKLSYYYENDKRGNTIFTKNDGMNGPITMLFVSEYDSLNRKTRTYFAHSNIGFSLSEIVFESNRILHYEYFTDSGDVNSYERDSLNKINSQEEFLALKAIQQLLKAEKRLKEIEVLDSNKNIITEIYFSEKGDTSSINTRDYDSNNKEMLFRYGIKNKEPWVWDIYSKYDSNSNLTKSIRISSKNGVKDTTEIYSYHYDSSNKLISKSYHYKKDFRNNTEYFYNKNGKVIEERFYEGEEFKLDVQTKYKYKKNGMLLKNTQQDFRSNGKVKREVFTYKLSYW